MNTFNFTAFIEKDIETGLYYGYIPELQGAHTQAESLDELRVNLKEVVELCLESLSAKELKSIKAQFIGTQQVTVAL